MIIKSSASLRNNYTEISDLARETGEPIYITINGNGDGVFMNLDAFEKLEESILMRTRVLSAEKSRLAGAKIYTQEEVDERIRKRFED